MKTLSRRPAGRQAAFPEPGGDEARALLVWASSRAGQVHSVGQREDEVAEVYGYVTLHGAVL